MAARQCCGHEVKLTKHHSNKNKKIRPNHRSIWGERCVATIAGGVSGHRKVKWKVK
jgi:hypothetical protein